MYPNASDVLGCLQAHMSPTPSPIGGAVDAVTGRDVAARARLAGPHEYDVGIGRRNRDCADGRGTEIPVGDVPPVGTAVVGLPHASGNGAEIERCQLCRMSGNRDDSAATVGTDASPSKRAEKGGIDGGGSCHVFFPRFGGYYTGCARTRRVFSQMVMLTSTARRTGQFTPSFKFPPHQSATTCRKMVGPRLLTNGHVTLRRTSHD